MAHHVGDAQRRARPQPVRYAVIAGQRAADHMRDRGGVHRAGGAPGHARSKGPTLRHRPGEGDARRRGIHRRAFHLLPGQRQFEAQLHARVALVEPERIAQRQREAAPGEVARLERTSGHAEADAAVRARGAGRETAALESVPHQHRLQARRVAGDGIDGGDARQFPLDAVENGGPVLLDEIDEGVDGSLTRRSVERLLDVEARNLEDQRIGGLVEAGGHGQPAEPDIGAYRVGFAIVGEQVFDLVAFDEAQRFLGVCEAARQGLAADRDANAEQIGRADIRRRADDRHERESDEETGIVGKFPASRTVETQRQGRHDVTSFVRWIGVRFRNRSVAAR